MSDVGYILKLSASFGKKYASDNPNNMIVLVLLVTVTNFNMIQLPIT